MIAAQRQEGLRQAILETIDQCVHYAQNYQIQRQTLTESETQLLDFILEVEIKEPTLEDALGLINPAQLTPYIEPEVKGNYQFVTEAAKNCLQSLDELIEAHKHTPIIAQRYDQTQEELLANCHWFPYENPDLVVCGLRQSQLPV